MRFLKKVKDGIENMNAKLNRGAKIGICSIAAALILCIAGVVNYNSNQKETAGTDTKATTVYPDNESDQKKDRKVAEVKDNNASSSTPVATPSSKPEEKKEEAPKPNKPASNQQNNKPAASNKSSNQKSSNGSAKQNQSSQKSCRVVNHPAETHQEPVYQIVHHDEVSHMEDYVVTPAWDEQVETGRDIFTCNDCGATFTNVNDLNNHADYVHDNAANYHINPEYKTVHHDAVMGQRKVVDKAAYDETVQTGTKTVTDKAAWQETVCN